MINLRDMESLKAEPDEQTSQMHISIPSPSPALHVHPPTLVPASISGHLDTEMVEAAYAGLKPSPTTQLYSTTSTPAANRTATPTRNTNGHIETSPMPTKAALHGAPARRYLNEKVTAVLLEGMKRLAADQPEDPLRVLGEYLLQRSKELENS